MPPQMESYGLCNSESRNCTPSPRTRRSLAQAQAHAQAHAAVKAKPPPSNPKKTPTTLTQRRSSRSRTASAVMSSGGVTVEPKPSISPSRADFQSAKSKSRNSPQIISRIAAMQVTFGSQLSFLVDEFTKMEAHLAPQVASSSTCEGDDGPQQQLARLRYFIEHVKHTMDRMEQARGGLHQYTSAQLDMLEEHITKRLLPVKDKMLAQLAQRSGDDSSSNTITTTNPFISGGKIALDESTAVSDEWMGSTSCSSSSSDGNSSSTSISSSCTESDFPSFSRHFSPSYNGSKDPTVMMTRPCSSLSLADLGELCGDQEVDDDCGGAFLVGGDCCDDVNGSAIGLDLYDLGQHCKDSFLPLPPRDRCTGRSGSMSTLSSVSAMTDGELSDDSLSLGSLAGGGDSNNNADAGIIKSDCGGVGVVAVTTTSEAIKSSHGIDQEMGELSELFAPDSFLISTVLDTEEMEATADAAEVASLSAINLEPTVKQEDALQDYLKAPAAAVATAVAEQTAVTMMGSVASAEPASLEITTVSALDTIARRLEQQGTVAGASQTVAALTLPKILMAPGSSAPVTPNAAQRSTPSFVPVPQECRCGQPACPSLISGSRKRSSFELSQASPSPFSLVSGAQYATHHQSSSRQRKRQRSLAPVLSAPRTVSYECSLCKESYQSEISSNPWWSLFRQECPRCHRMQIPRVDATSAAVSVDYIHAVCAEEGEACDSDGYGSDSCSESDDERDDDNGEGLAAFDTEIIAGDSSTGCPQGRLSTFQASRLLVLMAHARTCLGNHAKPQHAEVCRSTKFLMLHMRDCSGYDRNGMPCGHQWCRPCKSLLSHLVRCPVPSTCRICTPIDLPAPLRQLRELNVAQARAGASSVAPNSSAEMANRAPPTVKTEAVCAIRSSQL